MNKKQAKYTPGPWRYCEVHGDIITYAKYYGKRDIICDVEGCPHPGKMQVQSKDATLIAAAPELFELGRAAVADTCGGCPETYDSPWCNSRCNMRPFRDIIERLEGEVLDL